jgi:Tol biopolymer transport system component
MPAYNLAWTNMGIVQRDLESFRTRDVLRNDAFGHGCLNCHTFRDGRTEDMILQIRPPQGQSINGGMLIARDGAVESIVDTRTAFNEIPGRYLAWHPSGKAVTFTTNVALRCYHTSGFNADVVDAASDALIYRIDTRTVSTTPAISSPDRLETYTTWPPDGKYMVYCSAERLPVNRYREIRYSLMRIPYDIDLDEWGEPETLIDANAVKKSVTFPRFSPDGSRLLFCLSDFGNFPAFTPSADLAMMDTRTGEWRRLDISSQYADAYHAWSSNGRWFVFSSKRLDGFFTRLFLCHVDEEGRVGKPVLLPQEDPAFYVHHVRIFNVPELICEPVRISQRDLAASLRDPAKSFKATLDPRVQPRHRDQTPTPGIDPTQLIQ